MTKTRLPRRELNCPTLASFQLPEPRPLCPNYFDTTGGPWGFELSVPGGGVGPGNNPGIDIYFPPNTFSSQPLRKYHGTIRSMAVYVGAGPGGTTVSRISWWNAAAYRLALEFNFPTYPDVSVASADSILLLRLLHGVETLPFGPGAEPPLQLLLGLWNANLGGTGILVKLAIVIEQLSHDSNSTVPIYRADANGSIQRLGTAPVTRRTPQFLGDNGRILSVGGVQF